ncbi:MAG: UDP-N-acetylmuramoyl-tripeptide--D-alanyl-D-alanine ligase [Candidatus Binataceae bacterium]
MATPIPKNSCEFTLGEVAAACGGVLSGDTGVRVRGVSIDTRTIAPGELFVALRGAGGAGPDRDGHAYLGGAAARGAVVAIVEIGRRHPNLPCIETADTLVALGSLARRHLSRMRAARPLPVLSIGGAAGKTTTKELAAAIARAIFGEPLSTPGNLNNRIGVPMTIFTLAERHRAAVLECGTNTRGEIAALAQIVEPDSALVLNVDLEHTEGLGTLEEVAAEECAVFGFTRRFAIAADDEPLVTARIPSHLRRILFGKSAAAEVRLGSRIAGANGRTKIRIELAAEIAEGGAAAIDAEIGLLGEAAALNCAAAVAAAAAMRDGMLVRADLPKIAAALAQAVPVPGRMAASSIRGALVIDDTYNSNPRSLRAALDAAHEVAAPSGARLLIALGDMLELGALSQSAHEAAVRDTLACRPHRFVAVGPEMAAAVARVFGPDRPAEAVIANDSAAAGSILAQLVRPGDVLLVKGSRGIAMERAIAALR